jgi:non-ribosomal peptide synthetase component F
MGCHGTVHALVLECRYNADLFAAETIERWLGYYQTLLAAIVADAAQPLATLPLLSDAEQHTLLVQWNQTAADYPRTQCVHELIQQQAAHAGGRLQARARYRGSVRYTGGLCGSTSRNCSAGRGDRRHHTGL